MRATLAAFTLLLLAALALPAGATINSQSDGSDGALVVNNVTAPSGTLTIDLGKSATLNWNQASPVAGAGVYDSTKWAVVFKYTSVNILAGYTLKFTNHPANAPVVWLVQGAAKIAGTVNLDGETGSTSNRETVPGPGGFAGGRGYFIGSPATAGQGPGGAPVATDPSDYQTGGAYGTTAPHGGGLVYGNSRILPLIGGSGGGGFVSGSSSGGAGGGAILIVAGQQCSVTGQIYARGGLEYGNPYSGNGSGGAIRVIADTLAGNGTMNCGTIGGYTYGALGRIRLEANTMQFASQTSPAYSLEQPLDVDGVVIWPPAPEPTIKITKIAGQPVTGDPHMDAQALVSGDVVISQTSAVPIEITATNVPVPPATTAMSIRVVLGLGSELTVPMTYSSGDLSSSVWTGTLTALSPLRVSALQAKAILH